MSVRKITTKKELKAALNKLFDGISDDCSRCKYIDCRGYVWLHPCEVEQLSQKADTATINDGVVFIDSFIRDNAKIDPSKFQPPCRLRDSCGRCSIQEFKPIVCMLYPLNLRSIDGEVWLVLNEDCLFVDRLKSENKLKEFKHKVSLLWNRLGSRFRSELLKTFKKVDLLSLYPADYHSEVIKVLRA